MELLARLSVAKSFIVNPVSIAAKRAWPAPHELPERT
jgi:hypothetical protein